MSVMGELQAQLAPTIESFIENLRELKLVDMRSRSKAHSRPSAADVGLNWGDVEYYGLKAEQSKFPGSHKIHRSIGEYFPMELTTRKLLDMCGQVFGLSFSRLSGDESGNFKKRYIQTKKWPKSDSKDLLVFKVHDTSTGSHGALLGVLLLDLVDKKSKPQGAQCGTFGQCEVKNLGSQKWSPAIYIRAVFPPARKDAPVLVSSYNVITLAHELGHAIQEFTRGGLDSMAWDSVEIASHLVERLVSEPAVQRELSSHYVYEQQAYLDAWSTSGRSLPPKQAPLDLLEKGVDMYLHDQILPFLRTLWFTKLDFILHSFTEEMLDAVDLGVECQKALSEWTGICGTDDSNYGPPKNNEYLHYRHYQYYYTSLYCYPYSKICAEEIFQTHFVKDPLNRTQGLRFRKTFLEHRDVFQTQAHRDLFLQKNGEGAEAKLERDLWLSGRSENSMDALVKFLGRPPKMKPFVDYMSGVTRERETSRQAMWSWKKILAKVVS
ncbi:hypothetical protein ONS95_012160 [Cadophora gregata]|uniref:uncharacterized protein n=1 Tax=Cadophora gregata TaxID=51156 RepID=UPI0026DC7BD2|nr:uncharacterized protein ONS95_012160 [Cadophora gregata]KAK0117838.1 hypothetical protein ONS95_012160 [Cadophora gregata]